MSKIVLMGIKVQLTGPNPPCVVWAMMSSVEPLSPGNPMWSHYQPHGPLSPSEMYSSLSQRQKIMMQLGTE